MKHGTVLVADSHSPMLEGVWSLLEERFEAVVMVADEGSLLPTAEKLQPDLVIVDVSFPMTGTKNAVVVLRERFPEIQLIALSIHDESVAVERVLASGAFAYVLKRCATTDLVPALEEVSAGASTSRLLRGGMATARITRIAGERNNVPGTKSKILALSPIRREELIMSRAEYLSRYLIVLLSAITVILGGAVSAHAQQRNPTSCSLFPMIPATETLVRTAVVSEEACQPPISTGWPAKV